MERLDYGSSSSNSEKTTRSRNTKKRKWREIEAIKDRQLLNQELEDIDCTYEPTQDAPLED